MKKLIKIKFGVMSSVYEMKAEGVNNNSKMAMVLFIQQNVPIAIYTTNDAFSPESFLKSNPKIDKDIVQNYYKSIKRLEC